MITRHDLMAVCVAHLPRSAHIVVTDHFDRLAEPGEWVEWYSLKVYGPTAPKPRLFIEAVTPAEVLVKFWAAHKLEGEPVLVCPVLLEIHNQVHLNWPLRKAMRRSKATPDVEAKRLALLDENRHLFAGGEFSIGRRVRDRNLKRLFVKVKELV